MKRPITSIAKNRIKPPLWSNSFYAFPFKSIPSSLTRFFLIWSFKLKATFSSNSSSFHSGRHSPFLISRSHPWSIYLLIVRMLNDSNKSIMFNRIELRPIFLYLTAIWENCIYITFKCKSRDRILIIIRKKNDARIKTRLVFFKYFVNLSPSQLSYSLRGYKRI